MGGPSASILRARPPQGRSRVQLRLLNAFRLEIDGTAVSTHAGAQRIIAFLAVASHPMSRAYVAGSLWPDVPEPRAGARLRSALWRLGRLPALIVSTSHGTIGLHAAIRVDLHEAERRASRWMSGTFTGADIEAGPAALEGQVLPDWYEDWVTAERERFQQLRLHGLESMTESMIQGGRLGDALLAALAAVMGDPLRESAHRALISVHLAEGNVAEAIRQMRRCERLLAEELGVAPSARLARLVSPLIT